MTTERIIRARLEGACSAVEKGGGARVFWLVLYTEDVAHLLLELDELRNDLEEADKARKQDNTDPIISPALIRALAEATKLRNQLKDLEELVVSIKADRLEAWDARSDSQSAYDYIRGELSMSRNRNASLERDLMLAHVEAGKLRRKGS